MARIKPAPAPPGQVRSPPPQQARPRLSASRALGSLAAGLLALGALGTLGTMTGCQTGSGTCQGTSLGGAVVVRWRVVDDRSGRLFPRGQCCCTPGDVSGAARDQCLGAGGNLGSDCPDAPAWLIQQVKLRIRRLDSDGGGADSDYSLDTDCTAAERTTEFCLPPGAYELSMTAQALRLVDNGAGGLIWAAPMDPRDARVVTPSAVQRNVQAGQIVNLDVVVLGVNASQPPQ